MIPRNNKISKIIFRFVDRQVVSYKIGIRLRKNEQYLKDEELLDVEKQYTYVLQ